MEARHGTIRDIKDTLAQGEHEQKKKGMKCSIFIDMGKEAVHTLNSKERRIFVEATHKTWPGKRGAFLSTKEKKKIALSYTKILS